MSAVASERLWEPAPLRVVQETLDLEGGPLDRTSSRLAAPVVPETSVLRGADAPTWLVVKHDIESWGLDTTRTYRIIDRDYHVVTRIGGSTIYLHNGVDRSTPLQQDARP